MANLTTAILVILIKDNKVLFLKRMHGWGAGTYSLPGGNADLHESLTQGAIREVYEEVGITLEPHDLNFVNLSHIKRSDTDIEYLLASFIATVWKGEPFNKEPEKHSEIAWLDMDSLPKDMYPLAIELLHAYKTKKTYTEFGWD